LENIDDECEEKNIQFLKTSDEGIEKEYDLPGLPTLLFYRNKFRKIYTGEIDIHNIICMRVIKNSIFIILTTSL